MVEEYSVEDVSPEQSELIDDTVEDIPSEEQKTETVLDVAFSTFTGIFGDTRAEIETELKEYGYEPSEILAVRDAIISGDLDGFENLSDTPSQS